MLSIFDRSFKTVGLANKANIYRLEIGDFTTLYLVLEISDQERALLNTFRAHVLVTATIDIMTATEHCTPNEVQGTVELLLRR